MVPTQTTPPASGPGGWLAEVIRVIRIAGILVLLALWFVVVGTLAAVTVLRDALIGRSKRSPIQPEPVELQPGSKVSPRAARRAIPRRASR
jgi:hypothetical protein